MRNVLIVAVVVLVCAAVLSGPAYCGCVSCAAPAQSCVSADGACGRDGTMLKKLGRGACNAITFPFEVFLQMSRVGASDGPMAGWTWGLLKGLGMAGTRAAVGVYEIVTFPVPCPEGYRPILTDPEFFFEDQNW